MLEPITKRYSDESDMKAFRFTFYCDCCGRALKAAEQPYENGFVPKAVLTKSEREARGLVYGFTHREAYERANNEMKLLFDVCARCGDVVCDRCSVCLEELGGGYYCKKCAEKKLASAAEE